ncbi:methyltransferase [Shewanella algae]|uniref:methyltransferase n=1 Tax=Shewanella algae TaxID=38313 RepID=UPI0022312EA7|nr:methyltransferase [Shewanella algae]UZD57491.1 methyltransferase [Shewanella algae]
MTSQFSAADIQLTLHRYPEEQESNLQAWDAADEHLLKQLAEEEAPQSVLIINDSFGALLCAIRRGYPDAKIHWSSDARTSHLGARQNLERNHLSDADIHWLNSREMPACVPDTILLKLPKNLNFFAWQLTMLANMLPAGTRVLIGAKAKSINQALLTLIGKHLGQASASLAWKKTRVITAFADGQARELPAPSEWPLGEFGLNICNLSNVFAAGKLDIGARLMLANLPEGEFSSVVDLGCGNGVLGLAAAKRYPEASIHFVDDSEMAVESARLNWHGNGFEAERGHFYWDDCLSHLSAGVAPDLVLCNPPFHQGEAITDHIAWQMFLDARRRLVNGGILHVVGNRHLGYHIKLKRLFGNCKTIASNGKFVILQASK